MDLRIFKIMEVDPSRGFMKIKVWLRFQWIDDRLKWRPEDHGGLTFTHVWSDTRPTGAGPEIWVPDIQPWNSFTAMADTLDPVPVVVNSDGSVYYSRPGTLDQSIR
jgi:nicotinic acetylcholine receptor beta-3